MRNGAPHGATCAAPSKLSRHARTRPQSGPQIPCPSSGRIPRSEIPRPAWTLGLDATRPRSGHESVKVSVKSNKENTRTKNVLTYAYTEVYTMRFVSVRELRSQSAKILGELDRSEVVVTSNGTPVAVLTPVSAESVDLVLRAQRQARAALAMAELQSVAARRGLDRLSDLEIDSEIASARAERKGA